MIIALISIAASILVSFGLLYFNYGRPQNHHAINNEYVRDQLEAIPEIGKLKLIRRLGGYPLVEGMYEAIKQDLGEGKIPPVTDGTPKVDAGVLYLYEIKNAKREKYIVVVIQPADLDKKPVIGDLFRWKN